MGFKFNVNELKKRTEEAKVASQPKTKLEKMKFDKRETFILLLPSKDGTEFIKDIAVHSIWKDKKLVHQVGSPSVQKLEDKIMMRGWEIKNTFDSSDDDDLKSLYRLYMPRVESLVRVIDLQNLDKGVQVCALPKIVKNLILDELSECKTEEDYKALSDLEHGRILKVTHDGGEGIKREYGAPKFLTKTAALISRGKFTYEQVMEMLPDLNRFQPDWDDAKVEKHLSLIESTVQRKLSVKGLLDSSSSMDFDSDEAPSKPSSKPSVSSDEEFDFE
jgi:hypothetical protein